MNRSSRLPVVRRFFAALVLGGLSAASAHAGQVVTLDKDNWHLAPVGKEADAIYGDFLIRNDKVAAVVASALPARQLNLRISQAQGCVVDFVLLSTNNDQLTSFHPQYFAGGTGKPGVYPLPTTADRIEVVKADGPEVSLRVVKRPTETDPVETITEYTLRDGEQFLRAVTRRKNTGDKPVKVRLSDRIFHEKPGVFVTPGQHLLAYSYDRWFGMGYGVVRTDGKPLSVPPVSPTARTSLGLVDYPDLVTEGAGPGTAELKPGQEVAVSRLLVAGNDAADVQRAAMSALNANYPTKIDVTATDDKKTPIARAEVTAYDAAAWDKAASATSRKNLVALSFAFTDAQGKTTLPLPAGDYVLLVERPGSVVDERRISLTADKPAAVEAVMLGAVSKVSFDITDGDGNPSPAKVQFVGVGSTLTPDLGPDQRADGCRNLWFSVKGQFDVPLVPGEYYCIISRGPEYNAVWRTFKLTQGKTATIVARLPRVVDTKGWVSTDYHNHSTLSGDNSTQVEGRLAALIAEGVEFAPATEHQRITSYKPYLKAMGAEGLMATSDGIELTGTPLPLNHQNAFPLHVHPHTQFGGGPTLDKEPRIHFQRLRDLDNGSEKLIQQNHPDLGWLVFDRDGDGTPDGGYGTLEYTDVLEIWQPSILSMKPTSIDRGNKLNNRVFNWLQLLNQGYRIPGVANTDAHHCFHDSGTIRNWTKSPTDDVTAIMELDIVRASKKGQMVMSSGPFLEASIDGAGPGDDVKASGKRQLKVRVQCANWLDIDRVAVLVNGKPDPALNFTRKTHPNLFADGVVKFEQVIELNLTADAHVIVVAAGEQASTGPVMGAGEMPVAITNPIYVDADGDGFKANKDTLGAPLPVRAAQ